MAANTTQISLKFETFILRKVCSNQSLTMCKVNIEIPYE